MKFLISTLDFSQLITKLQNIVAQKAAVPILSNVMIEASGNEVILTATDLTMGMRCFIPAKVMEEGKTTLPARKLAQLLKELHVGHVELETDDNHITRISAGASRFKIHGMKPEEFPSLPEMEGVDKVYFKGEDLKEALYQTSFTVSREDNRYVLTGVYMELSGNKATFVGTDGKRLSKRSLPVESEGSAQGQYVIPIRSVEEMSKILADDEKATVSLSDDKISLRGGNVLFVTKLLAGDYPDVSRVIPATSDVTISMHREELMSLLRQVVLFTSESNFSVRFTFIKDELQLTANSLDVGEGRVSMPIDYSHNQLDIAFNPTFFLDILKHSKKELVNLSLTDSYNPGVITETEDDKGPLFVLMPMRLSVGAQESS